MNEQPKKVCKEQIITKHFVELRKILGLNQSDFAYLFRMSRQAYSKLEKYQEEQKMNYSTIFMISYTILAIINHKNFTNMNENQRDKIIEIKDLIDCYLAENTKYDEIINQLICSE